MAVEAIKNLRTFFNTGATNTISFRHQQLLTLKQAITSHEKIFIDALTADLAKPFFESYVGEIHIIMQEINHALSELYIWTRPTPVATPLLHFPIKSSLHPEPRGVILIIGAWNYPLQLLLVPLVGALAAGNCVVLKPSPHAPHTARAIAAFIAQTFPPEYVTVIEGNAQQTEALLTEKFDYIFFTGSPSTGKIIMEAAAKQLTPVTLELGGKNPCIVTTHASLDCAARRIVWGKFYNAGQNCISPDYLLIPTQIKDAFIEKMRTWIETFYGTDPRTSPDYARIIHRDHLDRLATLLHYGSIIVGGTIDRASHYMAPTLIDRVDLHSPLMEEEIFGPILPIITYETFNEAIAFINQRPQPLALYLFSNAHDEQKMILHQTTSGSICLNDMLLQAASPYVPFGGVGSSGFGAYHGKTTFDIFTHYKPVIHNSCRFDNGLRYPPYTKKTWFIRLLSKFF